MKVLKRKPWLVLGVDASSAKLALVAVRTSMEPVLMDTALLGTPWSPANCSVAFDYGVKVASLLTRTYPEYLYAAYVEAPTIARGGIRTTIVQAFVSGAFQAAMVRHGWAIELVPPSKWKKAVIGNGAASKSQVADVARQRWDALSEVEDQDLIDAACVAEYGLRLRARRRP